MSAPVELLPGLRTSLDGRPFGEPWSQALEAVRVRDRLGLPCQCELVFGGLPPSSIEDGGWSPGAELRIQVERVGSGALPLFTGTVHGIEQHYAPDGRRQVRIRAYDALMRLAGRQTVRAHRRLSVADLARELVADLGLRVVARDKGAIRRLVVQHRQSDLELLREHGEALGLYAVVRGRELRLLGLDGSGEERTLESGRDLFESRFDVDGTRPRRSLVGYAWDPSAGEAVEGGARRSRAGAEVGFGRFSADRPRADRAGPHAWVDLGFEDSLQVEAACLGELDRAACRETSFWGRAAGSAEWRSGVTARVLGVDRAFEGRYVLSSVLHSIDRQHGFYSELSSYPPRGRARPTATAIVPGRVSSVDDPERLGRVKARLPTFGDVETEWMRVVSPGLGGNRGFVALPDVDDQVAIALGHEDPARGLVLGGIFDGRGRLDSGVEGGRVRRFQLRAGDQVIRLDEQDGSIGIENASGSRIELSADGVRIHAAGGLRLEAPGERLLLKAARIDMEQG